MMDVFDIIASCGDSYSKLSELYKYYKAIKVNVCSAILSKKRLCANTRYQTSVYRNIDPLVFIMYYLNSNLIIMESCFHRSCQFWLIFTSTRVGR